MVVNFVITALLLVPPFHRWVDRGFQALRAINLEEQVGRGLQLWLIGSTIVATGLLGWLLWQKRRAQSAGKAPLSIRIEGIMVAVWWVIVLVASAYAYMLGLAG